MSTNALFRTEGSTILLENGKGFGLTFIKDDGGYGGAEIFREGVSIGRMELFKSRRHAVTKKSPPYYHVGPLAHRFSEYRVEHVTESQVTLVFSGESTFYSLSAHLTFHADRPACAIRYQVKAAHPFADTAEAPFTEISFAPPQAELVCAQYPLLAPMTRAFPLEMDVQPQRYCAPFLFSLRQSPFRAYALGVGYGLDQSYWDGRIRCREEESGSVLEIFPLKSVPISGETVDYTVVLSTGENQGQCIGGYREACGYRMETPFCRTISQGEALFMSVYKNCHAYIEGRGYRQQIHLSDGKPAKGDVAEGAYGKFIPICANVGLAHNLYKWWARHPEETWARDRAFEMVGFFQKSQRAHGGVPNLYLDGEDRYITYVEYVRECRIREGRTSHPYPDGVCRYTTHMMSMAVYYLYRLYLERKAVEGVDCQSWRDSAVAAMDYLAANVMPDGMVGRNYTDEGEYDDTCADVWLLIALDYMHGQTGKQAYADARGRMETWTDQMFASINHWYNWSADGGFWHGEGQPPINHDAFELPTYATYCAYRYLQTGERAYLDKARDTYEYLWLCMIPIQYEGYSHLTKGLVKEQDTYSTFDVPFNTTRLFDCMPLLTALTGDRFYMDFYKFLLQLQMAYQATDFDYPAFYIGLDWAQPDTLGEGDVVYISEFAGVVLLDSINSPYCYRFLCTGNETVGLDAPSACVADIGGGVIKAVFATCQVSECRWDSQDLSLLLRLKHEAGATGCHIGFALEDGCAAPSALAASYDGKRQDALGLYNGHTKSISLQLPCVREAKFFIRF